MDLVPSFSSRLRVQEPILIKGDFVGIDNTEASNITAFIFHNQTQIFHTNAHYKKSRPFKLSVTLSEGDLITLWAAGNPRSNPDDVGLAAKIVGP